MEKLQVLLQGVGLGLTPVVHVSGVLQPLNLPLKVDGTLGPIQENFDIGVFVFNVLLGKAVVEIKGSALEGHARFSASSPEITSTDLPIALPLTQPLQIKNLYLVGEAKSFSSISTLLMRSSPWARVPSLSTAALSVVREGSK